MKAETDNFTQFMEKDLSEFSGEWVIMSKGTVVEHGKNLKQLVADFRKSHKGERPFIVKAPSNKAIII
ncbi:MAG: DUF5678 domain-containing protein [Candidatus Aenigmatarchaeota archaeon]